MIGNTEIKHVQMADNTTAFVEDTKSLENMLKAVIIVIQTVCRPAIK